jgi:hypothetical protein
MPWSHRKSPSHSDRIRLVWDLDQRPVAKALVASLVFFSVLVGGCSDDTRSQGDGTGPRGRAGGFEEGTLVSSSKAPETTREAPPPEATLGPQPDSPAVVLRLEGDPGTSFSGICIVGSKRSVLSGRIPKRYAFDPRGRRLSCRIEKRDPGRGDLKVILVAGDTTRSVQQTDTRGSVINVSYAGN